MTAPTPPPSPNESSTPPLAECDRTDGLHRAGDCSAKCRVPTCPTGSHPLDHPHVRPPDERRFRDAAWKAAHRIAAEDGPAQLTSWCSEHGGPESECSDRRHDMRAWRADDRGGPVHISQEVEALRARLTAEWEATSMSKSRSAVERDGQLVRDRDGQVVAMCSSPEWARLLVEAFNRDREGRKDQTWVGQGYWPGHGDDAEKADAAVRDACRRFHPDQPCRPGENHPGTDRG